MSKLEVNPRCLTPPASLPVTLEMAKAHLKVTTPDEDTLIAGYIEAAAGALEAYVSSTARCLMSQVWVAELSSFPDCPEIVLDTGPVRSITSIKYIDVNGVDQTLALTEYQFVPGQDLTPSYVAPAFGKSWPVARLTPASVRVTYAAGYAADTDVPRPIKNAILMDVADFYRLRESQSAVAPQENPAWKRLLKRFRGNKL